MPLALQEDLSFCRLEGRVFLLNLTTGRYCRLADDITDIFIAAVTGASLNSTQRARLKPLLLDGMLIETARADHRVTETSAIVPVCSIVDGFAGMGRCRTVARALLLVMFFAIRLRLQGVKAVVRSVERNKAKVRARADAGLQSRIAAIVAAFVRLDLLIGRTNRCVPRSAAMVTMLLAAGCRADMIFGVAARPFNAHCWVQHGSDLLSDRVEQVHDFTPILRI